MSKLPFQQKFRISSYSDSQGRTFEDEFKIVGAGFAQIFLDLLSEESPFSEIKNKTYLASSSLPFVIILIRKGNADGGYCHCGSLAVNGELSCLPELYTL